MSDTFTFEEASAPPSAPAVAPAPKAFSFEDAQPPKTFSFEDAAAPKADLSGVKMSQAEQDSISPGPREDYPITVPPALNPNYDFTRYFAAHPTAPLTETLQGLGKAVMTPIETAGAALLNQLGTAGGADTGKVAKSPQFAPGTPTVQLPTFDDEAMSVLSPTGKKLASAYNALSDDLSGLTTPGSLMILPLAGESKAVQAAFLSQTAAAFPELTENVIKAKSSEERIAALTHLMSNAVMTGLLTKGVFSDTIAAHLADKYAPRGAGIPGASDGAGLPAVQTPEPNTDDAANATAMKAAAMTPEQPGTLAAQLDWVKEGKRAAVLVTPGAEAPPVPDGMDVHPTDAGTFIYSPERTSPEQIDQAVAENKIGDLLGYGIADKPAPEDSVGVVTVRGADGMEKQAVVTDEAHLTDVLDRAQKLAGDSDTVKLETPQQVIAGRRAPVAAPAESSAVRFAREQREANAALRAQTPPSDSPAEVVPAQPQPKGDVKDLTPLKPVEISPEDYKAARQGNNPFMEVSTATGLAKEMKRAQEFSAAALNERPGETEPHPVTQMFAGDQFKIKGQPMHVAEWVMDAETGHPAGVNVDGAYGRQFVPADQTMHLDAGTLTDPVSGWFDKAIDATNPLKPGQLMEGVTGAPVWLTKTAVNAALKIAKFAYTKTRDVSRSVGEALRFLRSQNLPGYNEGEALNWLESNLRGDPVMQDTGRAQGAATEERRPLENTSAAQQMSGSTITTGPFQQDLQSAVTGQGWRQRVGGWLGGLAGETFPKTTRALRELGEQGARWISSRQAANPLADAFSADVTRGLNLDDVEFGALLHEDNLRSIKQATLKAAEKLAAEGQGDAAQKLRDQAQRVFSFVGEGGVFPDEVTYQKYLASPTVQVALQRHLASWQSLVDPMYREAMKLDPDTPLASRGLQTGARINLNFVRDGEAAGPDVFVAPTAAPKGVLSNVLQRRSPFGRMAKGTAEAYRPSYTEAMRNTYGRQLEIANRNKFDRMMVESGNAVIDKPGQQNELKIKGEGVTPFEIKRTVLQQDGKTVPVFQNIYVRNSLAEEYRSALNPDAKDWIKLTGKITSLSNKLALAGLAEVTAHVSNLSHALFTRPGVTQSFWSEIGLSLLGRADAFVALARAMKKLSAEDRVRIRELTEIGAMREPAAPKSNYNPAKWGGHVIEWADRHTRVQLDRMYQNLAEQGLVQKSETARREFVNQVGQYNRRAQSSFVQDLRDSGVGPFVTAGRSMYTMGIRNALLHPGIESTNVGGRLAIAATLASKMVGAAALIAATNYVISAHKSKDGIGRVTGRPGIPLGAIDLGFDDKNGRPYYLDLSNLLGYKKMARETGLRATAEALRVHLPIGTTMQMAMQDAWNAGTAPAVGPALRTAWIGISGQQPAFGVPRTAPIVPPGQNQLVQNAKTAAIEMNPVLAGFHDMMQHGATGMELLQRQLGRFTIQPGKAAQLSNPDTYAKYVDRAQASNFIDDVIGRARKLQGADRMQYVVESVNQLDPQDRPHALRTLEERRIIPRGSAPR